ncbi:hypothetical protein HET69_14235 [Streptomyces sp. CJ_13]|uniref:hypothetical protein n=1 Tax=Streptomyces sp. CJ_13 TaxID=2724943 RepID=UPI001BDD1DF4|nr:hypothetical protein [Streptomyces sp. CJ_13]MBT1185139.1 hypothetical protein [Streptomyces sp. CJ_13]
MWVLVRVGEDRTSFHTDLNCAALHSKLGTGPDIELMTETAALELPVKKCGRCWL